MKGTTYSIRIVINKAHSKNHYHSTIDLSEIFIIRLSRSSFSSEHNPEADCIWYKKYTIDDKKAYNISNELPDYGYEWTNGTKCTGVLEYSHPDENYSRARQPAQKEQSIAYCRSSYDHSQYLAVQSASSSTWKPTSSECITIKIKRLM